MNAIQQQRLPPCPVRAWRSSLGALAVAAVLVTMSAACTREAVGSAVSTEPWGTNSVAPSDLVKQLASAAGADKPMVVYTGPTVLYRSGHIPGAVLHGPASSPDGLNNLTTWARSLPRSANLVIYCGCCPVNDCPNVRPAYTALRDLGFTRVRVLLLPSNFGTDWVAPGYPVER
jgi:hypothetical protein